MRTFVNNATEQVPTASDATTKQSQIWSGLIDGCLDVNLNPKAIYATLHQHLLDCQGQRPEAVGTRSCLPKR